MTLLPEDPDSRVTYPVLKNPQAWLLRAQVCAESGHMEEIGGEIMPARCYRDGRKD
jgi:hypothetical protein